MTPGLQTGFTLVELLVALLVFGIMSVLAYGGLRSVLDAAASAGAHADRLAGLQRTFTMVGRDVEQLTARDIRDEYGDRQPALRVGGSELLMELTRAGWRNPAGQARPTLQRVAYRLDERTLYRLQWGVLDRAVERHCRAGPSYVFSGHYEGEHWLASFAVYLLTDAGRAAAAK